MSGICVPICGGKREYVQCIRLKLIVGILCCEICVSIAVFVRSTLFKCFASDNRQLNISIWFIVAECKLN